MSKLWCNGLKALFTLCLLLTSVAANAIGLYQYEYTDEHGVIWYLNEILGHPAQENTFYNHIVPTLGDVKGKGECIIVGWNDSDTKDRVMEIPGEIIVQTDLIADPLGTSHWKGWYVSAVNSSAMTDAEVSGSVSTFLRMPYSASVASGTFKGMATLEEVSFEDSQLTKVPENLFQDCRGLRTLNFTNSKIMEIGAYAFTGCSGMPSIDLSQTQITTIGRNAFEGCYASTSVKLPATLASMGEQAFKYNSQLKAIDFTGTKLTVIPTEAFKGCVTLADVVLGEQVTEIGSSAFAACGIRTIEIPQTISKIGAWAFGSATSLPMQPLEKVYFRGEVPPTFADSPFRGAKETAVLYVPTDCAAAYKTALGANSRIGKYANPTTDARTRIREQMKISKYGYNSYYLDTENFLVPQGVTAYIVTGRPEYDKRVDVQTYAAGTAVPKQNGFFLYAPGLEGQTVDYEAAVEPGKEQPIRSKNCMQGSRYGTTIDAGHGKCYILAAGPEQTKESVGFYYQKGTAGKSMTLKAHSAGLVLDAEMALSKQGGFSFTEFFASLAGETTGIEEIGMAKQAGGETTIYDMQGRRVGKPMRGMYIVNGKKVVIK